MGSGKKRPVLKTREDALRYFLGGPVRLVGLLDGVELHVPVGVHLLPRHITATGSEDVDEERLGPGCEIILMPDMGPPAPAPEAERAASAGDESSSFAFMDVSADLAKESAQPGASPLLRALLGESLPSVVETVRRLGEVDHLLLSWPEVVEKQPGAPLDYRQLWTLRAMARPRRALGFPKPELPFLSMLRSLETQLREYFSDPAKVDEATALVERNWPDDRVLAYLIHRQFESFARQRTTPSPYTAGDGVEASGAVPSSTDFAATCLKFGVDSPTEIAALAGLGPGRPYGKGSWYFEKNKREAIEHWKTAVGRARQRHARP